MKQIACFLTCGYTEAGAMQAFLRKINPRYDFRQWLPNKTRKRRGSSKSISSNTSGLTGSALLTKVCDIVTAHREEISECAAIICE